MRIIILTTIILLFLVPHANAQAWLNVTWGDSREEVHYAETGQLVIWDLTGTLYEEEINGTRVARKYRFIENKLVAATQFPTMDRANVNSENLFDEMDKIDELQSQELEKLGVPDFIDDNSELSVKHYGWNLDGIFAISQVNKSSNSGVIWYSPGQLTGNTRNKRFQNQRGALRSKYRKLVGEDIYSFEDDPDLPPNLKDNPSLTVRDKLISIEDEMEGRNIYRDPSIGNKNSDNELALFLIEQNDEFRLILNKTYSASDWLFINSLIVLTDGERYRFDDIYDQISRQTTSIGIRETYQIIINEELEMAVRSIANANEARIRLNGENTYRDITITEREKRAMRNILALYDQENSNNE